MDPQPEDTAAAQTADPDNGVAETQDQLLEIYKLHAQLLSQAIQRQLTINRFYQLTLFGVCILLGYLFSQKAEILWLGARKEKLLFATLGLGIGFSTVWSFSVNAYILTQNRKLAVLKHLEDQLAYPFFVLEQKIRDEQVRAWYLFDIKVRELLLPMLSLGGFSFSYFGALQRMPDTVGLHHFILPYGGFAIILYLMFIPRPVFVFKD